MDAHLVTAAASSLAPAMFPAARLRAAVVTKATLKIASWLSSRRSMLTRKTLRLRLPHQRGFMHVQLPTNRPSNLGFGLLARFMRQRGLVIGLGGDLGIERGDQLHL